MGWTRMRISSATDIVLGPFDVRGSVIRRSAGVGGQVLGPVALNVGPS
jgi:hypothetical protein